MAAAKLRCHPRNESARRFYLRVGGARSRAGRGHASGRRCWPRAEVLAQPREVLAQLGQHLGESGVSLGQHLGESGVSPPVLTVF